MAKPVANVPIRIKSYDFNEQWLQLLKQNDKGSNWPIVYVLHDNEDLYVGETSSAISRMNQHIQTEKRKFKKVEIILDDTFNKSAILDVEQNLIKLFNADWKYNLWNWNWWQSTSHDYYQREAYVSKIDLIWEKLKSLKLCNNWIDILRNSDLFKYSPYNNLTEEQEEVSKSIIYDMISTLSKWEEGVSIIKWWAWTWKTIVLINMMYKLIHAMNANFDKAVDEDSDYSEYIQLIHDIKKFINEYNNWEPLKIAYVSQMDWLRNTIKFVFSQTKNWLKWSMAKWPTHIASDYCDTHKKYDIVFVDEVHRLCQYKNITWMWAYKTTAKKCWMTPEDYTCLDFIMYWSKYRVLVYDDEQTVKWSDITPEQFKKSLLWVKTKNYELTTQMRCKWWKAYIDYVNDILRTKPWLQKQEMGNWYEFKIYDDADEMINKIKELDKEYGLCRNVCSESWQWKTKGKKRDEIKDNNLYDIEINWKWYVWNTRVAWWLVSPNAINEIWCIHTVQWYDLNYVWLIFWKEIDYDEKTKQIVTNKDIFWWEYIKKQASNKQFHEYIINAYKVIMTRWIKWCYVYAYNEWLRKYLSRFIDKA